MADDAKPDRSAAFAAKATDLDALRAAVIDAAGVGAGLWISYLFVLLYMLVAAGGITHRDLLLESPIKLPFLSVELPLVGFFVLGPLLFLIVHAYVLLHFVLLADKVGVFHQELAAQIADDDVRAGLRRQLPSNIFVQFLAGPREVRTGLMGFMLRLIAQISLVAAPLALLVFIQLQFLPYHNEAVVWWQRIAVVIDLALLWTLWPSIARGETTSIAWRDLRRVPVLASAVASLALLLLVFCAATFPGEWLDRNPVTLRFIPGKDPKDASLRWLSPHEFLLGGEIDLIARKPTSLWSNRLVLPGLDLVDHGKFDSEAKIIAATETFSLRGRRLEQAVLIGAHLRKVDFTAAKLTGAVLNDADLRDAKFNCAPKIAPADAENTAVADLPKDCAELQDAWFIGTKLQRANLDGAQLQRGKFFGTFLDGATLVAADLQGAAFPEAQLRGASLDNARLQGASLMRANLRGASLVATVLLGVRLGAAHHQSAAHFQGAFFRHTQLYGAVLGYAFLSGAMFDEVYVWRALPPSEAIRVVNPDTRVPWTAERFAELKALIETEVRDDIQRRFAMDGIKFLDPAQSLGGDKSLADAWTELGAKPVDLKAYEATLHKVACDADAAPYVIQRMLGNLPDRFEENSPRPAALAAEFLDEAKCPGAKGLTEEDKAKLRQIRDRPPAGSAGSADATPKQ